MDPGLTAALAMGLGAYAQATLPSLSPRAVALAAIVVIAAANVAGLRLAGAIGHFLAVAKIALLAGARPLGLRFRGGRRVALRAVPRAACRRRAAGAGARGCPGDGLLLVRRLVGGRQARRRGARSRTHAAARARARRERGDAALRRRERRLPVPGPDRDAGLRRDLRGAGRPGALRRERRPRALGAGGGVRELGALRLHDLRAAALLRDGARRRGAALRRLDAPAHRNARDGDRPAGGARRAAGAARQLRDDRRVLRVRDRGVPGAHGGRALPAAAARAGRLPRAGLARDARSCSSRCWR